MWEVNPDVLHATAALGGSGLEPFYQLLEGGKEGPLAKEMEEYFYYSQMRSQSVATTKHRKVRLIGFITLQKHVFYWINVHFYITTFAFK